MNSWIADLIAATELIHGSNPVVVLLIIVYALTIWGFIRIIRYLLGRTEKLEAEKEALQALNSERAAYLEQRIWSLWEKTAKPAGNQISGGDRN